MTGWRGSPSANDAARARDLLAPILDCDGT